MKLRHTIQKGQRFQKRFLGIQTNACFETLRK